MSFNLKPILALLLLQLFCLAPKMLLSRKIFNAYLWSDLEENVTEKEDKESKRLKQIISAQVKIFGGGTFMFFLMSVLHIIRNFYFHF